MVGLFWNGIFTFTSIWRILVIVALSPLAGFLSAALVIHLCGYQFTQSCTTGAREGKGYLEDIEPSELEDGSDSEMYL